jgi:hypothetical protein
MVKLTITLALAYALTAAAFAQDSQIELNRTSDRILTDGKMDEPAWSQAQSYQDFVQCFPKIGAAPSENSEVRMMYDDEFLYIGVVAYDSIPTRIIATGLERDIYYGSDDLVCITLDTYNDKRQGILFASNPLGARFDEEVLDNGNSFNAAYNTFWNVKSSKNAQGYTMEFQIPFSSLRFEPAEKVVMGLKIIRYIKHKNEFTIFPAKDPLVANAVWRVNNGQEIVFKNLRARKPFYFIPYAKADFREHKSFDNTAGTIQTESEFMHRNRFSSKATIDKVISNVGFDFKYGLSKNFTLDVTVNTDFAQAETDNRIFNFTRFAVNLPEKRNFFLESKDYLGFTTGSNLLMFNSRTIGIENGNAVPIIGGLRLTGKANGLQVGVLDLQTHGVEDLSIDPQHFNVLRARKEIGGNGSFIGGIVTNRMSTTGNDFNNQAIGLDLVKRFRDNKWLGSINVGVTNDKGRGFFNESSLANVVVTRVASLGLNHLTSIEYAEKSFKPLSGFAADSAYVLANTSNGYIWKWKNGGKKVLYWITNAINYKYRTINNTHESIYSELELGTSFKSGSTILITPFGGREFLPYNWNFRNDIVIPLGYYSFPGVRARYDSKQTRRLNYSITGHVAGFLGGQHLRMALTGYYALNRHFRFTYNYEHNAFEFPKDFSASNASGHQSNLFVAGIAYAQSIYFSAKALVQYDDISKTVGCNFRLRFNPKEGTDLYIVYNPRVNTSFTLNEYSRNRTVVDQQILIVKFSKAISL